jgi:hypothetical protein
MTFTIILSLVVLPVEPHPPPLYGKGSERQKSECRKYKSWSKIERDQNVKSLFIYLSEHQNWSGWSECQKSERWKEHQKSKMTFDVLIFLKILSMFWPFDLLIFDVPTPSPLYDLYNVQYVHMWATNWQDVFSFQFSRNFLSETEKEGSTYDVDAVVDLLNDYEADHW